MVRLTAVLTLLVALLPGCTSQTEPPTLRVLATSELADIEPLLGDLRAETGVNVVLDLRGSADELAPGHYEHDVAWLSSDRHFQLKAGNGARRPLSTPTMLSPVVIGMRRPVAATMPGPVSWARVADRAAAGGLTFAMAAPRAGGSGLAALVGVATAAAGTGRALRGQDVTCDRLRGLFTGQKITGDSSAEVVDQFVARQDEVDAIVSHESVLLSLNDSGRLREPLEIVYPADGIVQSEYPLLLLDDSKRAEYDLVAGWLRSAPVQQRIMERTARRPINPDVQRTERLSKPTGNALYFPDEPGVIDTLLANYATKSAPPHVIFLLDFSGSMRGDRITGLRKAFADLTGAGDPTFARFAKGERFTVVRFGATVLAEQEFSSDDLAAARDFVGVDSFDDNTAVWSTVDHAYDIAATKGAATIVLMTDGQSNAGISADAFLDRFRLHGPPTTLYALHLGSADPAELSRVTTQTGGRAVDAAGSLPAAFKEIRGCR